MTAATTAPPVARRLGRGSRLDPRLVTGVLLLLLSVVAGDRLLTTGRATSPVLAATHDLAAGHVVGPGDVVVVRVRLTARARSVYLPASAALSGRVLDRAVGGGELVPAAAVGVGAGSTQARLVALAVADGHRPALARGDVVDVYVTAPGHGGGPCTTALAVRGVEVADDVPLAATSGTATVVLRVPVAEASAVVLAAVSGAVDVVVRRGTEATPDAAVTSASCTPGSR